MVTTNRSKIINGSKLITNKSFLGQKSPYTTLDKCPTDNHFLEPLDNCNVLPAKSKMATRGAQNGRPMGYEERSNPRILDPPDNFC